MESPGACWAPLKRFKLQVRQWEEHGKRGAAGRAVVGAEAGVSSAPRAGIRAGGVRVTIAPEHPVCCFGASFVSQLCQLVPLV